MHLVINFIELDDGRYYGEMLHGRRVGFGTHQYLDGSSYEGNWANDKMDGKGCLKFADKSMYFG